jgi:photosystem II stability/assembly factor-like uncharacterized protein
MANARRFATAALAATAAAAALLVAAAAVALSASRATAADAPAAPSTAPAGAASAGPAAGASAGPAAASSAGPAATPPAATGPARKTARAAKALLLGGARAGQRLVAVGEFGHVVLSDDAGATWRQAEAVPTTTTLTAVTFIDARAGWAVGHGGVVLGTTDAGEHWTMLSGRIDGKDPLFSVWFKDATHGLAVGPYGFAARTEDGGRTWDPFEIAKGEDGERHLNQIVVAGRLVLITAENGLVFRSEDEGETFKPMTLPYKGSIWGGAALADGSVLVWGMRGTVLRSTDQGLTWKVSPTGTDQSLAGGAQLADGTVVVAGLNGTVATSKDGGVSFTSVTREDRANLAAVLPAGSTYVMFGTAGAQQP